MDWETEKENHKQEWEAKEAEWEEAAEKEGKGKQVVKRSIWTDARNDDVDAGESEEGAKKSPGRFRRTLSSIREKAESSNPRSSSRRSSLSSDPGESSTPGHRRRSWSASPLPSPPLPSPDVEG